VKRPYVKYLICIICTPILLSHLHMIMPIPMAAKPCALASAGGASEAGGIESEVSIKVVSPDTFMDSMRQDVTFQIAPSPGSASSTLSTSLPDPPWRLALKVSRRFAKLNEYNGISAAYLSTATELAYNAKLKVSVGRLANNWSLWQGDTVVLSPHAPGYDQLQYSFRRGPATVDKIIGRLSGDDRYLFAHRLTLTVGGATAAIGETAVCNRKFAVNLVSFLPWPYYWTQWVGLDAGFINNNDVNVYAFVQGMYRTKGGALIGAELMVDDMPHWFGTYQIFQVAGLARAELPLWRFGKLNLQYVRVNNYTYSFQKDIGHYVHHDFLLGFPYGPDGDELHLNYQFARPIFGFTDVGLIIRRHGEGRIGDTWEKDGYEKTKDNSFLTGVVESAQLIYTSATYQLLPNVELSARFGVGPVQNAKNRKGYNKVTAIGFVDIKYHMPISR